MEVFCKGNLLTRIFSTGKYFVQKLDEMKEFETGIFDHETNKVCFFFLPFLRIGFEGIP